MIYLASPYSHDDPLIVEKRFQDVCRIAAEFMRQGHVIYSPIAHTHPIATISNLPKGWEFWEKYDREFLIHCDQLWVVMLDGWEESRGVQAEIEMAREFGKPIRYVVGIEGDENVDY